MKKHHPFFEPARAEAGFKFEAAFAACRATFPCLKNTRVPAKASNPSDEGSGMGLVESKKASPELKSALAVGGHHALPRLSGFEDFRGQTGHGPGPEDEGGGESGYGLVKRFEGSVGAEAHALAAPFDTVAEKCQEPKGCLEEVLDRDEPGVAPGRLR